MIHARSKYTLAGLAGAALVAGSLVAAAQPEQQVQRRTTISQEIADLEIEVKSLSPEEKMERGVEKVDAMKKVLLQVTELSERVRNEERDILKLNCINEKGTAIKGFVKVSEQSYENLKLAVAGSDVTSQNHHYTLIAISGQKVNGLGEEALVCAGEVLQYSDETQLELTTDPEMAEFDFIVVDFGDYDFEYILERPPEMTLFQ